MPSESSNSLNINACTFAEEKIGKTHFIKNSIASLDGVSHRLFVVCDYIDLASKR